MKHQEYILDYVEERYEEQCKKIVFTWKDLIRELYHIKLGSFVHCALGIYACFVILSIYQERISMKVYPHINPSSAIANLPVDEEHEHTSVHTLEEDKFKYAVFIVFLTCLVNTCFSYARVRCYNPEMVERGVFTLSFNDLIKYLLSSLCFVSGTIFSHSALNYVTYPTQVLFKSCKLIPVMISTVIVARRTYRTSRYVAVLIISIGISIFMIDRMKTNESHHKSHSRIFLSKEEDLAYDHSQFRTGIILLILSLLMDGITNGIQTIVYNAMLAKQKRNPNADSDIFMLNINFYATVISSIFCIAYKSEMLLSLKFLLTHKEIIWDLSILCICMAVGQMFIFRTITNYGPLVCSMLTTVRKFFTILFSVLVFHHNISIIQWIGVALVFSSLLYDIYETLKWSYIIEKVKKDFTF
jgi:UDP-galactose transporter B1